MSKTLTPLVLLLVVSSAPAAPKVVGDHTVKPGGFAALTVEGAGKTVLWSVSPEPIQDAEFAGVLVFTGVPGVTYTAIAIVIDFDKKTAEKLKHAVKFEGARPDPGPGPRPDPGPTPPDPKPPTGQVKFVLFVEETADAAAGRGAFFADQKLAERMAAKGVRWRAVDRDVVGPDGKPPADIARFLEDAKGKVMPRVYLIDTEGRTLYSGVLVDNPERLIALLEKHGG